jgi:hypothetical protein
LVMSDETRSNKQTVEADERDAVAPHGADRAPTPEEEAKAEEFDLDPRAAKAYEEAIERGAKVKGEGQIG